MVIPFTLCSLLFCRDRTRERVKGNTAFPFTIPAAPRRNRCFALRSPPAPLPAVGKKGQPWLKKVENVHSITDHAKGSPGKLRAAGEA
ncbi:hypothetical protein C2U55_15410 [Enterobacteriaceae bacterium ENNIH3]|nr:hypothetical protein C2U55_15410 [Enterobacteriaceae bacterium ENNIH3]AUV09549.1 hypothetical protein C2U52_26485 [Enterobacteriaceae bacterium ENNIH2]PWF51180.1 hypothetical protein BHT19_0009565 [[Kluyvera] intestini]